MKIHIAESQKVERKLKNRDNRMAKVNEKKISQNKKILIRLDKIIID